MERHDYIPLLGLALRGGRLAVGAEAVENAVRTRKARLLLLSGGASERTRRNAGHLARSGSCVFLTLPCSREELGQALGRASASLVAVTDTGLAAAVGERLAALDPERFAQAAQQLKQKDERARQRRGS